MYERLDECDSTENEYNTRISALKGLELAKYILIRLVDNPSIERLAEDFDNDVQFMNGVVEFLKDIGWIEQDQISGLYYMKEIARTKVNTSKVVI